MSLGPHPIPIDPNAWSNLFGVWLPPAIAAPLIVAICTFFATLAFNFGKWCWRKVISYFDQIIIDCPIDLTWLDRGLEGFEIKTIPMYCLIVRFGNDMYLTQIASDQEKFEGRLQNLVIPVDLSRDIVKLRLPVHRRIGTQFKLYLLAPTPKSALDIWNKLTIYSKRAKKADGNFLNSIKLDEYAPKGRKIWFRLENFDSSETVDGHLNNICLPDRIKNFENHRRSVPWTSLRTGEPEDD